MQKLVGFSEFVSKKGKDLCILHVVSDPTQWELSRGFHGQKTETMFLPDDQLGSVSDKDIGKEIDCVYEYIGNFRVLRAVKFK